MCVWPAQQVTIICEWPTWCLFRICSGLIYLVKLMRYLLKQNNGNGWDFGWKWLLLLLVLLPWPMKTMPSHKALKKLLYFEKKKGASLFSLFPNDAAESKGLFGTQGHHHIWKIVRKWKCFRCAKIKYGLSCCKLCLIHPSFIVFASGGVQVEEHGC